MEIDHAAEEAEEARAAQEVEAAEETEEIETPDFEDPSAVLRWFGASILDASGKMLRGRSTKSETRLHVIGRALDIWAKLFKIAADTSQLAELKTELAELREMIELKPFIPSGPQRVVK